MERKFAFIDESGSFGGDLNNPSVTKFFILTAVLVDEDKIDAVRQQTIQLQKKYFSGSELKSSRIGGNHKRRIQIIEEITKLPISFLSMVYDKEKLSQYPGLKYKQSFYKFLNQNIYSTLVQAFPTITVTGDSTGNSDFIDSFLGYLKNRCGIPNLFEESAIMVCDSKAEPLIQLADIISGTLAYEYDERKHKPIDISYDKLLEPIRIRVDFLPVEYSNFNVKTSPVARGYDHKIAEICFNQAKTFLKANESARDTETIAQCLILKYLLFRFMNNPQRNYIPTKELINYLKTTQIDVVSQHTFRNKIIGKLRDSDVIIASSSGGYKIPTCIEDLNSFISHNNAILLPMISRLKKCTDIISLGTNRELDLLAQPDCEKLAKILNAVYWKTGDPL